MVLFGRRKLTSVPTSAVSSASGMWRVTVLSRDAVEQLGVLTNVMWYPTPKRPLRKAELPRVLCKGGGITEEEAERGFGLWEGETERGNGRGQWGGGAAQVRLESR